MCIQGLGHFSPLPPPPPLPPTLPPPSPPHTGIFIPDTAFSALQFPLTSWNFHVSYEMSHLFTNVVYFFQKTLYLSWVTSNQLCPTISIPMIFVTLLLLTNFSSDLESHSPGIFASQNFYCLLDMLCYSFNSIFICSLGLIYLFTARSFLLFVFALLTCSPYLPLHFNYISVI
jgi:hypothetical protein